MADSNTAATSKQYKEKNGSTKITLVKTKNWIITVTILKWTIAKHIVLNHSKSIGLRNPTDKFQSQI